MNNFVWVLDGEPKDVVIVDKDGNRRHPDLKKVIRHKRLKPGLIAGKNFGFGVGAFFYGGRLGKKGELAAQGNQFTTNDEILRAIGYVKEELPD